MDECPSLCLTAKNVLTNSAHVPPSCELKASLQQGRDVLKSRVRATRVADPGRKRHKCDSANGRVRTSLGSYQIGR